jgi:hypothetical protein
MATDDELAEGGDAYLEVPSFASGGRVERTTLALVHEGEYVSASPAGASQAISLTFPVEIEVIGELTDAHKQAVAEYVYDQLDTALRSRA